MLEYRDMSGNLISEGDFIVYAAHRGRSSVLKFGIVTRLVPYEHPYNKDKQEPTLRAITVEKGWSKSWNIQNHGREIKLGDLNSVLVVSMNSIPYEVNQTLAIKYSDYKYNANSSKTSKTR